ncbi:MAG: hypothetical protein ABEJ89_06365 [Haloarculaceae archaeon]
MRNTPTDERGRERSSQGREASAARERLVDRVGGRLRTAASGIRAWIGGLWVPWGEGEPAPPVVAEPAEPPVCPEVEGFPPREYPLVYPDRDSDLENEPEVIGVQTDERIILSHPDNRDARIVSDVWEEIEP